MEEQVKQIKEESQITKTKEPTKVEENKEVITNLPEWSIEPPLKINRGNKWHTKNI